MKKKKNGKEGEIEIFFDLLPPRLPPPLALVPVPVQGPHRCKKCTRP